MEGPIGGRFRIRKNRRFVRATPRGLGHNNRSRGYDSRKSFLKHYSHLLIISTSFDKEISIMRPSVALDLKRSIIRETTSRFRVANPRVFGSVLYGPDRDGRDLDLLVDALPGATLLDLGDLGDLEDELKSLLGVDVDLLTPGDLPPKFRAKVLAEVKPV